MLLWVLFWKGGVLASAYHTYNTHTYTPMAQNLGWVTWTLQMYADLQSQVPGYGRGTSGIWVIGAEVKAPDSSSRSVWGWFRLSPLLTYWDIHWSFLIVELLRQASWDRRADRWIWTYAIDTAKPDYHLWAPNTYLPCTHLGSSLKYRFPGPYLQTCGIRTLGGGPGYLHIVSSLGGWGTLAQQWARVTTVDCPCPWSV
jgi:hypothetical protein